MLRPGLLPIAGIQPGVCPVCRSAPADGYPTCYECRDHRHVSVVPISMSVHPQHLHHHLRHYKDDSSAVVRQRFTLRLAALLSLFLDRHLDRCLGGPVDLIATVPSVARDAP